MPAALMMIGTMRGEISSAVRGRRQGSAGLDRPRAASVPSTVASTVADTPMIREFSAAFCHCSPKITCSYQRREYASGSSSSMPLVNVK